MYCGQIIKKSNGGSLGNIRPTYIKRVAIELIKKYPDEFTQDYQHNKRKVEELTDVRTDTMRNRIAGMVTRYVNQKMKKET
jgi:small subunit ribosomal protein S17e